MTDCLIIGFNDSDFKDFVTMTRAMGADSGAYRDLNLAFVDLDGQPYHSMDLLNRYYFQDQQGEHRPFHNSDFLWPVITYLGTYLKRRGFTFDYVNLFQTEKEKLREALVHDDILTIVITTTLYVSPQPILEILAFIREHNSRARVIIGGPYIANQSKMLDTPGLIDLFRYFQADFYVISSEGELALANILKALKTRSSFDSIDNIAYRQGNDYIITAASIESNSLEENMVDYGLFPAEELRGFVTLRTAKSCPFACSFCGFPSRAGKYTYLDVNLVQSELDAIRNLGSVHTLTFIDDTFNVPKGRFKEILRMMIRNNYGFKWNSYLRSDHVDQEAIDLMARAGCEGVFLGVESGSDLMLAGMNKTSRRKDYLRVIPQLRDAGIASYASLIVGFPGETYETVEDTLDLVETARPDFYRTQLWYCDPTTPIWQEREKYGVKGSAFNWSHDTMDVKTACDLIDRSFLTVKNSVWLPQNGFEMWSLFYLKRQGMQLDQIKTFLKCFNALVKQKMVYGDTSPADPALLDSLMKSCRFDAPVDVEMRPVKIFADYLASERFWVNEFGGTPTASNIEAVRDGSEAVGAAHAAQLCDINHQAIDLLRLKCHAEIPEIILAAYSLLLSRLNGQQETVIIASISRGGQTGVVPLRLYPNWELSFRDFTQAIKQKMLQAAPHRLYAFYVLTNPLRMAEFGCCPPVLDVSFEFVERGTDEASGEDQHHGSLPGLRENLGLILQVEQGHGTSAMTFNYSPAFFKQASVEKFGRYLNLILEEASKNSAGPIEEIAWAGKADSHPIEAADASEIFTF
jgi:anaerobic magnesium-protoporphyrin IX monomethyl ester cyclase